MDSEQQTYQHPNSPLRPKIVLTPDSFKGSLSAREVAQAMSDGIRRAVPDANIVELPIADGGEGTIDALLGTEGKDFSVRVRSASGRSITARVAILADGTGVVEVASIVGITDPDGMSVPFGMRTTFGVGDSIKALLARDVRRIYVALGGSSTSDGGAGMLVALGARLNDSNGDTVAPLPVNLHRVRRVDLSNFDVRLTETELILLCDVHNPLNGPNGAAAIFGPQKGGLPEEVAAIDNGVAQYAGAAERAFGIRAAEREGAGAAGGLGFALMLLGGSARNGASVVLDAQNFDTLIVGAQWHVTGEGRSDLQSIGGKAPSIAAIRASNAGVPTTLVSGSIDLNALHELDLRFTGCFSIAPGPVTLDSAIRNARLFISTTMEQLARLRFAPHSRSVAQTDQIFTT
ncbi:glycerate kinase [Paraburkholderia caribensis]|uniref:glycerate kinase n=1 Tax=Paraburkholderia caribensis TaxID=75105 RepID=UPI00072198B6|nr:glycerate kinase [Paraburkholderia caribensis]ALP68510.1 hypothetical protein AN416_37915 [Paraburkholderia caribensis]AUT57865.1 glycerate kinase [Paraburkholderia caribensis]